MLVKRQFMPEKRVNVPVNQEFVPVKRLYFEEKSLNERVK